MFTFILILTLFLPVALLPLALNTLFSPAELTEMGVCLENQETVQEHDSVSTASGSQSPCANPLWEVNEQLVRQTFEFAQ